MVEFLMRVLLVSDVHGNIAALDAVLQNEGYDDVLFAGDAVDYGPFPFDVYSRLKQIGAKRVLGNHDAAAAFGTDCRSSPQLHEASVFTRRKITMRRMPKRALQALGRAERRMDLEYGGLRVRLLHASPSDELYQYISKEEASRLEIGNVDLLVLGHTHIPYEIKDGGRWIVNPGSVGMPKDGDPRAAYAVLDTYRREVRFGRIEYDVELMLSKLKQVIDDNSEVCELLVRVFRTGAQ